jgi:hypothetical protein
MDEPTDPHLDSQKLATLAGELAKGTFNPVEVLKSFGLTVGQLERYIAPNPFFKQAYDAALVEWNSSTSTVKRIKTRSAAILEDSLPALSARLTDHRENLPAVVETAKLFAKLAGAGEEKSVAGPSDRFTISINIGSKKIEQVVEPTIDITPQRALESPND